MTRWMLEEAAYQKLVENHAAQENVKGSEAEIDFTPVCRLMIPLLDCCWLLTELNPYDDIAFGLADLGLGFPELGSIYMPEVADLSIKGLRVVQDRNWAARKTLREYADDARRAGCIRA